MIHKLALGRPIFTAALIASQAIVVEADTGSTGSFRFAPIDSSADAAEWDRAAPWKIPDGFEQSLVSGEKALNIYDEERNDWPDMNTVNETGKDAGRFLYRTHEVRDQPEGGAISVVDLGTRESKILAQDPFWNALDGIRWTPWQTLVFAEETQDGRLFELVLDKHNRMAAGEVIDRPSVGRLAHEGIEFDDQGNMYMVDEHRGLTDSTGCGTTPCGGGIYKYMPTNYGDLSSGKLYVLKTTGGIHGTGRGEWVGPIDPLTARKSGSLAGGNSYQRPEDLEVIGDTLYVAITEGPRDSADKEIFEGRVLSINLSSMQVANFVVPGVNAPVEIGKPGDFTFQTGFDSVDNLAETPEGDLMMIEDNKPSDIWVATRTSDGLAERVRLFASLTDPGAEGSGIYFGKDPNTLFVNIQHSAAKNGDGTWVIRKTDSSR